MELASVSLKPSDSASFTRGIELASQLRTAAINGDDGRIAALLAELLRVRGLTKGQRVRLQLRALSNLVHSLRSLALNDELTGLCNRRGFLQTGTRLLDLAIRDARRIHLVYFRLAGLPEIHAASERAAAELRVRQMGNFMRDLFPSYGVYEVLGRLKANDFAALTPNAEHAVPEAILARARAGQSNGDLPLLPLEVAVAHFNPFHPFAIDELVQHAVRALRGPEPHPRIASVGHAPQPGMTLS